jgi:hypothetical protein
MLFYKHRATVGVHKNRQHVLKTSFKKIFTGRIRAKNENRDSLRIWGNAVQMKVNRFHRFKHPHLNVPGATGQANLRNPEKSG